MVGKSVQVEQLAKNVADGMCFPDTRGRHMCVAQPPHCPPLHLSLSFKSPSWVKLLGGLSLPYDSGQGHSWCYHCGISWCVLQPEEVFVSWTHVASERQCSNS